MDFFYKLGAAIITAALLIFNFFPFRCNTYIFCFPYSPGILPSHRRPVRMYCTTYRLCHGRPDTIHFRDKHCSYLSSV